MKNPRLLLSHGMDYSLVFNFVHTIPLDENIFEYSIMFNYSEVDKYSALRKLYSHVLYIIQDYNNIIRGKYGVIVDEYNNGFLYNDVISLKIYYFKVSKYIS